MDVRSVTRWEMPIETRTSKLKKRKGIAVLLTGAVFVFGAWLLYPSEGFGRKSPIQISESVANELRAAVSERPAPSEANLGEIVARLDARVKALEGENQRLTTEMNQLLDHDGVINTLIAHVRSLHAQSEATRRDVVDALMAPLPEVDGLSPSIEGDSAESTSSIAAGDGASTPLLTKARHTIVTPVAASASASVVTAEKHKAKSAPAEPDEGNTN